MKDFFFDTANTDAIKNIWDKISKDVDKRSVRGITTNPNAFAKLDLFDTKSWFERTKELCKLVTEIRGDDYGVVYIQCPKSTMSDEQVLEYAKMVKELGDDKTEVGLKISPSMIHLIKKILPIIDTNVTGVSDVATAFMCDSRYPDYISIIPGRMEEVGINAKAHIKFLRESNIGCEIISGSMRTLEQLMWTYHYDTIPTIGEKVFDLILDYGIKNLPEIPVTDTNEFPLIDERNIKLSREFFEQMDKLGDKVFRELFSK